MAMGSLLLGILGCVVGGIAVYGVFYDSGDTGSVKITGDLGQMQEVLVEDTKTRGIKQLIASFGERLGWIGFFLGLFGLIAAITHLLRAVYRQVIPQFWLASFGAVVSLIAFLPSIFAAATHSYDANVGLHVENTKEVFNRLDQVSKIQKKAQDIAEGNAPLQPGSLDEKTMALAESLLGGTLNPITQLWTEEYLNRRAPNVEVYTTTGVSYSIANARNTRVILMVMSGNSPACIKTVPLLNQLRGEFGRGQLLILAVSIDKPVVLDVFVKRTAPKFPVGTASFLPEPYADAQVKPTFFIIDRIGFTEQILVGPQTLTQLRAAARGKP
jgi:hypothetical protein